MMAQDRVGLEKQRRVDLGRARENSKKKEDDPNDEILEDIDDKIYFQQPKWETGELKNPMPY